MEVIQIFHTTNNKNNGKYKYVVVLRKIDGTCPVRTGLDTKCLGLTFLECKVLKTVQWNLFWGDLQNTVSVSLKIESN